MKRIDKHTAVRLYDTRASIRLYRAIHIPLTSARVAVHCCRYTFGESNA